MIYADSIIYGHIVTLDVDNLVVEAMVVKNKRIVYLGTKKIAKTMQGKKTKVLDYGDNVVYPGFMDGHTHGPMAGERLILQADLTNINNMRGYVKAMAKYVKKYPNKKYYLGAGWDKYSEPTAKMLDEICPDKPMILRTSDGHSLWINTVVMKECNVDKEFVKKWGEGQVHVDKNGNPSGLVCERALDEVLSHYPVLKEDMKDALLAWQDFAFSQGITAVGEALVDMYPVCIDAYDELVKEGKWKLRTYAYAANKDVSFTNPEKVGESLKTLANKYNCEYFNIVGLKIILDGVVEAHTAAMIDEYLDQPGYYGELNVKKQDALNKLVLSANKAGLAVHTHAIGDKASKMILDAYQYAETQTCDFDRRNVVCHLQIIRPEDIKRCADYNVIAVVAPTWVPITHPTFDETLEYLGEKRAWSEYPIKAFEDAGATICFHTDYPINQVMDVPLSVYTAVKRSLPKVDKEGGPKSTKNPDEAISSLRSLMAMTINIAYMFRKEKDLGTFEIGKIANATVYNRDFIVYEDPEDIYSAELVATIVDGEEVYKNRKHKKK